MKDIKVDWNIHAVYKDKEHPEPIDIHTHGLEKHGIYNICMMCPTQDLIQFCGAFVNHIAMQMINGEKYSTKKTHYIDNKDDYNEIYDVFDISTETRDNGEGDEKVYVIDYWFYNLFVNPYNSRIYAFDFDSKRWRFEADDNN